MCKICLEILKDKNSEYDWVLQSLNWVPIDKDCIFDIDLSNYIKLGNNGVNIDQCICGVKSKLYTIYNPSRLVYSLVGSSCIHSYKSKDQANVLFNRDHLIVKTIKRNSRVHCKQCNVMISNTRLNSHNLTKRHINNVVIYEANIRINELKKKFRECKYCKEYNIDINKSANIKACTKCANRYVFYTRNCIGCNSGMTLSNYENYNKICYKCKFD